MKIAIIGCGYVGSALGAALVERGHSVIGTTTTPARVSTLRALGVDPAVVELADVSAVRALLSDRQTVFMLVAPGANGPSYREVYLEGVEHLLRAAAGSAVRHIVYTSSTSVYGQDDGRWVDEDAPTKPSSENGRVLVAAERVLREGARTLPATATVLRLAGIYGPRRGPANRVPAYGGQERTDGDGYVNLIHRDDIVQACIALLDAPYAGVLNLSDAHPVLRRELYDDVLANTGRPPIRWVAGRTPDRRGKRVSSARIQRELGVRLTHPTYDFDHRSPPMGRGPVVRHTPVCGSRLHGGATPQAGGWQLHGWPTSSEVGNTNWLRNSRPPRLKPWATQCANSMVTDYETSC